VLIDSTGVIRWGAQPAVGIPRVELNICQFALGASDTNLVMFDPINGSYRLVSPRIRRFIEHIATTARRRASFGMMERIRTAFAFFPEQVAYQDYETARRLADAVAGSQRSGVVYNIAKFSLRVALWTAAAPHLAYRLAMRHLASKPPTAWAGDRSIVLVSHKVNQHPLMPQALNEIGATGAHIVHDLIPVFQPELTGPRFAKTMSKHFRSILTDGDPIIAVSNTTRDDLLRWNAEVVKANYPLEIAVCPLGAWHGPDDEAEAPIPELMGKRFAVYCSSIELRKNHDLLVAVWRELANVLPLNELPDLVLIGRKTSGWKALQTEIAACSPALAAKIHVLQGLRDMQLRWAYRHALLGLFPSSAEGWGLGVSECLGYGLPVLISDIPVLHEVAQGLMPAAPVRDVAAWTSALRDLIAHPDRIDALRQVIADRYRPLGTDEFAANVVANLRRFAGGQGRTRLPDL
jgi:hypothetical protein